jgi:hypothetical protein
MGKLSNVQNTRLGGLIAVLSGREPYDHILAALIEDGFVMRDGSGLSLTESGMNEKDRLATLAGLMVQKDYAAALKASGKSPDRSSHTATPPAD